MLKGAKATGTVEDLGNRPPSKFVLILCIEKEKGFGDVNMMNMECAGNKILHST